MFERGPVGGAMKQRPILFSGPMVRALLEARKTQTRRAVKLPHQNPLGEWEPIELGGPGSYLDKACTIPDPQPPRTFVWHTRTADMVGCPYGAPGDRLWVKETWARPGGELCFRADGESAHGDVWKWAPSIHMRRADSRITLELAGVRVERLQDISEADAIAEGIAFDKHWEGYGLDGGRFFHCSDPRRSYEQLWESINGAGSWDANPWVWVVTFKRA